ncbi:MAG: hypothetical protein UX62_C0053G0010 [Microgenomates group bacterium GW2011_GWA2_46_7]|nr:MAG: hypothetical protein UX62_C0053G0010 [Microgenomates group bacterium GW2011_GWA2_46_7]KKU46437.1 MAG: hypothetical protein UX64_C0007G0007 [Microgenomates group bacterium GW2011_GWC2_46_7]
MVDIRINLLKNRSTLSEAEYRKEREALRRAVYGIVVVVVVLIALSIWNLVLTVRLKKIETEITDASREMQGLVQASASQIYLKSRLQLITDFLNERSIMRESLQKVLSNETPGTHISKTTFIGENILRIQVSADDSAALTEVLKYYQENNAYFIQVVSQGISRTKDGSYQLSLDLTIPRGES